MNQDGMKMIDEAIEEITKLIIKEDFDIRQNGKETMYIMSKKQLMQFVLKAFKVVEKIEKEGK